MTYDDLKLDDGQILDVLSVAREHGAMAMIHAENADCIEWLTKRLEAAGRTAPRFHAHSRPMLVEREATHRAIALSELVDVPILIVHVSGREAVEQIRWARAHGLQVHAETCPQYLFLTAADLGIDDSYDGARCVCSPPPRDKANQQVIWDGLNDGLFTVFSSDHAPFRYDAPEGKKPGGKEVPFRHIPNGIPGLETRLPLLYSEGVLGGRITLEKFVELTSTNPAKAYGLHPRKGTIALGSDADLVIWDEGEFVISNAALHHEVDYTPYEGMRLRAWPGMTLIGGDVVWDGTQFHPAHRPRPFPQLRQADAAPGAKPRHEAAADQPQYLGQRLGADPSRGAAQRCARHRDRGGDRALRRGLHRDALRGADRRLCGGRTGGRAPRAARCGDRRRLRRPGADGLREALPCPVTGLTEAALASACLLGQRFSIVAISQRIRAWYRETVEHNGLAGRLASIRGLDETLADIGNVQGDRASVWSRWPSAASTRTAPM